MFMVYQLAHQALADSLLKLSLDSWGMSWGGGTGGCSSSLPRKPSQGVRLGHEEWQGLCIVREWPQKSRLVPF